MIQGLYCTHRRAAQDVRHELQLLIRVALLGCEVLCFGVDERLLLSLLLTAKLVLQAEDVSLLAELLSAELTQLTRAGHSSLQPLKTQRATKLARLLRQLLSGLAELCALRCLLSCLAGCKLA